jgi:hypothetical protein
VTAGFTRTGLRVEITADGGLDRVDVFVAGRPIGSEDVTAEPVVLSELRAPVGATVLVEGYAGGELVAARRVTAG